MSKWIEVIVKQTTSYLVEVDDGHGNDEAFEIVENHLDDFDDIKYLEVAPEDIEDAKRWVDDRNIIPI